MSKILLVDDDADILLAIGLILERNGFEVTSLSDCREVIQTTRDILPDLILLDVNLGYCDGRQLCLELKSEHHFRHHILLFSANPELVESIELYKADEFIAKPFSIKEFVRTIREHVSEN